MLFFADSHDFIFNPMAVICPGVFPGKNRKLYVVPLEVFGFAVQERTIKNEIIVALDIDKDELENLPGFDKATRPVTLDSGFVKSVYNYHGQDQPRRGAWVCELFNQRGLCAIGAC